VVEVGVLDAVAAEPPAAERQVAAADEHEIAVQGAARVHAATPVDGGGLPVAGAERGERRADGEQLARRPGQRQPVRVERMHRPAAVDVRDEQAPARVGVAGLVHDRLDRRR
jgi:hypothetical protein